MAGKTVGESAPLGGRLLGRARGRAGCRGSRPRGVACSPEKSKGATPTRTQPTKLVNILISRRIVTENLEQSPISRYSGAVVRPKGGNDDDSHGRGSTAFSRWREGAVFLCRQAGRGRQATDAPPGSGPGNPAVPARGGSGSLRRQTAGFAKPTLETTVHCCGILGLNLAA